jgi:zinc D-Ala-D-Ala dipeptidase
MRGGTAIGATIAICVGLAMLACLAPATAPAQDARPPGFVDAATVVDGLVVDMRYFGTDNFVGEKIDGYERPVCLLAAPAARALAKIQHDLAPRRLGLKVFDCYRPARTVAHFVRWARRPETDPKRKAEYYPDIDKRDLFRLGYVATRSGHSRGATVDLTIVRRTDGAELDTELGTELDMGTHYDFAGPQSWPSDKSVSAKAQDNRALLARAMTRDGFVPYSKEWWHFTLANEPFPHTYFDFPVR